MAATEALAEARERAYGCLLGGAVGDALGMPTQSMTAKEITTAYGRVTDFIEPVPDHPIAKGLPAGSITDDTEQTLLLARRIAASPDMFDEVAWARSLAEWEVSVRRRGRHDLLGPSTKRALLLLDRGEPVTRAGVGGTTNGAAMRIAPVGISTPPEPLSSLIDRVVQCSRITHNTGVAIAAAAAVAAAVSAGIDGATYEEASRLAIKAARQASKIHGTNQDPDMAGLIVAALSVAELGEAQIANRIGTGVTSEESVPAAFAVLRLSEGDAWEAGLLGANIGDDTDTIAAIAGSIAGACGGAAAIPEDRVATVFSVNDLEFRDLADELVDIREARRANAHLGSRAS